MIGEKNLEHIKTLLKKANYLELSLIRNYCETKIEEHLEQGNMY